MNKSTLRLILISALLLIGIIGCSAQEVSVSETSGETVQNEGSSVNSVPEPVEGEQVAQVEPTDEPTIQPTDKPTNTPSPTDTPSPTNTPKVEKVYVLPDLGKAPDITNETWINADPHTLEDLRGKVVLVEFWTFG